MAEFGGFPELARPLRSSRHPADDPQGDRKRDTEMELLNNKAAAAVFSLAFSLIMFATAIAPANGGALLPGGMLA